MLHVEQPEDCALTSPGGDLSLDGTSGLADEDVRGRETGLGETRGVRRQSCSREETCLYLWRAGNPLVWHGERNDRARADL